MIMQPEFVKLSIFKVALEQVEKKKNLPALSKARFQSFNEGRAAQIMYFGAYSDEGPTIQRVHEFIKSNGYTFDGLKQKHHEMYLSDLRKTSPDKLKTIIRQPFQSIPDKSR